MNAIIAITSIININLMVNAANLYQIIRFQQPLRLSPQHDECITRSGVTICHVYSGNPEPGSGKLTETHQLWMILSIKVRKFQ